MRPNYNTAQHDVRNVNWGHKDCRSSANSEFIPTDEITGIIPCGEYWKCTIMMQTWYVDFDGRFNYRFKCSNTYIILWN